MQTIALGFYNFKIRIWNYFSNFSSTSLLQLRLSAYDPAFYMPSISTLNLQINFAPDGCRLNIQPLEGQAYNTNFTISVTNCYDEDTPLTYRYQYYLSQEAMQTDVLNSNTLTLNTLTDYISTSSFETWLPANEIVNNNQSSNSNNNNTIVVVVSVQDSLGAYTNITQQITVNNYSSQLNASELLTKLM